MGNGFDGLTSFFLGGWGGRGGRENLGTPKWNPIDFSKHEWLYYYIDTCKLISGHHQQYDNLDQYHFPLYIYIKSYLYNLYYIMTGGFMLCHLAIWLGPHRGRKPSWKTSEKFIQVEQKSINCWEVVSNMVDLHPKNWGNDAISLIFFLIPWNHQPTR